VHDIFLDEEIAGTVKPPEWTWDNDTSAVVTKGQWKKTFFDIGNFEDTVAWLTGPFVEGMYPTTWYNSDPFNPEQLGYLRNYLKLVDGVRMWQVRVSNDTCSVSETLGSLYGRYLDSSRAGRQYCYGPILPGVTEDRTPYGPGNRYVWLPQVATTDASGVYGWGESSYGRSGYATYLPADGAEARRILANLVQDRWLDDRTRALMIDFNLYNADSNLLTVARFMVEFLPTGLFLTSYRMYTFKLELYASTSDVLRAMGEVLVLLGCAYYMVQELQQLAKSRPRCKYFSDLGNAFDLTLQACMICCIIYWVYHIQDVEVSAGQGEVRDKGVAVVGCCGGRDGGRARARAAGPPSHACMPPHLTHPHRSPRRTATLT
jgi:hypothetical protein